MTGSDTVFRLYGSEWSRRVALGGAVVALVAGAVGGTTDRLAAGLGAAFALAGLAALIRVPDVECAFCRRSRRQVKQLVAGPSVSICEECVPLSLGIIAEASLASGSDAWARAILQSLPLRCPRAVSAPLFRLTQPADVATRGALLREALRLSNEPALIELMERVVDRRASDWITLGLALEREERFAEALVAIEQVANDPSQAPWLLNNRASSRLGAGEADPEALRKLLEDTVRASRTLTDSKPPGWERVVASILGTSAECHRRLGALPAARAALAEAERLGPANVDRLHVLAQLEISDGKTEEAREVLSTAIALAHPEAPIALRLRVLLEQLSGTVSS